MATITKVQLENASLDAEDLSTVVNGSETAVASTRSGRQIDSLAKAIAYIKSYNFKGDWQTGYAYVVKDLVVQSGVVYMVVANHTSGTFATDLSGGKLVVYQGTNALHGVILNNANELSAAGEIAGVPNIGTAVTLRPTSPGYRGELQIMPNDDGALDDFAGGEVTILMKDPVVSGYANSSAFTMRGTRDGDGNGLAWTFRGIQNGTDEKYPIEFDAVDGVVQTRFNTDGSAWFLRQIQISGAGDDYDAEGYGDVPSLRLGPQDQPAIDFEDSGTSGKTYRLRSIGGEFTIVDIAAGNNPLRIKTTGVVETVGAIEAGGDVKVSNSSAPKLQLNETGGSGRLWSIRGLASALDFYDEGVGEILLKLNSADGIVSVPKLGVGTNTPAYRFVVSNTGVQGIEFAPGYGIDTNLIQHYDRVGGTYLKGRFAGAAHEFAIGTTIAIEIDSSGNCVSGVDGAYSLGRADRRFSTVYASTGTINTSDKTTKQQISAIPDEWLDAWQNVEYCRFKFNKAVDAKGEDARWHAGLVAQQVYSAFADKGLDAFEIGFLCLDKWDAVPAVEEVKDDKGAVVIAAREAVEAGELWGLRRDECEAMEAALQRRTMDRIIAQMEALQQLIAK